MSLKRIIQNEKDISTSTLKVELTILLYVLYTVELLMTGERTVSTQYCDICHLLNTWAVI